MSEPCEVPFGHLERSLGHGPRDGHCGAPTVEERKEKIWRIMKWRRANSLWAVKIHFASHEGTKEGDHTQIDKKCEIGSRKEKNHLAVSVFMQQTQMQVHVRQYSRWRHSLTGEDVPRGNQRHHQSQSKCNCQQSGRRGDEA